MSSDTTRDVDHMDSDEVRIEELEKTVDFVQQRLKIVEGNKLALLRENDYLYDLQDQFLIGNDEQIRGLKDENEHLKAQLAKSEEGKV